MAKTIGHTSSGKPVYAAFQLHPNFAGWTAVDHWDAADVHETAKRVDIKTNVSMHENSALLHSTEAQQIVKTVEKLGLGRGAKTPRRHSTRKSGAQLDREIAQSVSKRAHSTIKSDEQWEASVAERRKRDPGAWSSRAQLVAIARAAANNVFFSRKVMTPALIKKANEAAWKAIKRHDPLAGTSDHPAAAHAHGIYAIAAEGVTQAERVWVPAKEIRSRWAKAGRKLVSHDKRFTIVKEGEGYNLIDLDTYNEYPATSLDKAKSKARSLKY